MFFVDATSASTKLVFPAPEGAATTNNIPCVNGFDIILNSEPVLEFSAGAMRDAPVPLVARPAAS